MEPILSELKLGHFRCFERFQTHFSPGLNLIVGPNAVGKTSLLEAACVLLRLQSPRTSKLADLIQRGARGLVVDGYARGKHLQFYYSLTRKKLALDSVEQKTAVDYLQTARVVWFSNTDIELVRGSSETRRRFLDFVAAQSVPGYRQALLAYGRALRARNLLLKQALPRWKEIQAFDAPLLTHGTTLNQARETLCLALQPLLQLAHAAISHGSETITARYLDASGPDFSAALAASRSEDARLRQTTVGPHRDDWEFILSGHPAATGSEGQQRTFALALRLAAARYLEAHTGQAPLLLLDDIFGELDAQRRAALLAELPKQSQQIVTTTQLEWLPADLPAHVLRLGGPH